MKSVAIQFVVLVAASTIALSQDIGSIRGCVPSPTRVRIVPRMLDTIVLTKVMPLPPWDVDKSHKEGTVSIAVLIDRDGSLMNTSVISGDPTLAQVATAAIKQWTFKPFTLNHDPVQVESVIQMTFSDQRAAVVLSKAWPRAYHSPFATEAPRRACGG